MATKLYLRSTSSAFAPTAGDKSSANPKYTSGANNASSAQESLSLSTSIGASTQTISITGDASTATRTNYMGRWTSDPLASQSIASGTWTIALFLNESNTNANSLFSIAVYLAAQGGSTIKATIYDSSTDLGAEWSATGAGQVVTFSGSGVTAAAGDVLVVEVFRNTDATGQAMATAYAQVLSYNGTSDVTAGGAGTGSYLQTPSAVNLTFATFSASAPHYRFYQDGTESGSTAYDAQDTNITLTLSGSDIDLQYRQMIQENGGAAGNSTDNYRIQYSKNGGAWVHTDGYIASYTFLSGSSGVSIGSAATYRAYGYAFKSDGNTLDTLKVYRLWKTGAPTGNVFVKVYAHTGTFGTSGTPTGSALATSDALDISTLGTASGLSGTDITFTFSGGNRIALTDATSYFFTVEYAGGDASNFLNVFVSAGGSYDNLGNAASYNGTSWTAAGTTAVMSFAANGAEKSVQASTSTNVTNGSTTPTNRLTGGSGVFQTASWGVGYTQFSNNKLLSLHFYELLAAIKLKTSLLSGGDTLDFRFTYNGTALSGSSPRITVTAPANPPVGKMVQLSQAMTRANFW